MEEKARIIQELVPGKQVTIAHLIAHPDEDLAKKMGVPGAEAVGILTLSPREAAMIAGDFATKAASVQIGFVDRFTRRTGHSGLRSQRGRSLTLYGKSPSRRTGLCRMRNDQELTR